jgi:hypothetical protein
MCDYSLMMVPNRLAIEGEDLVAHRFQSGTKGFISCSDFAIWQAERRSKSIWKRLTTCFSSAPDPTPVVCIPPGARLLLEPASGFPRAQVYLASPKIVTFTQLSAEPNQHRDALRLDSGAILSVATLAEGQKVKVLRLSSSEEAAPRPEIAEHV